MRNSDARFGSRAAALMLALAAVLAQWGSTPSARATEPDKAPPVVTLSGTAVKAVEEGKATGTYELHIVATDGSKAVPQSGVAKIEVGVDGSGQQSWEKSCPEGSCGLEEKWTYSPASYLFESPRWITVKVTDHAGNVTEEEVSIEGIEEIREAAPTGPDTTAPTITFLGSAVEAVETGATSGKYELRMLARDGSPTAPQSGVSKIEVAVDGTTVQSWEKYCPVGSCRLKIQWPYTPASFTGTGHVLTVTVRDHAGNVTTRTIRPDTVPPVVELSGALTEGLREGITSYPLHVHATDGNPEFPGSGLKKITISVDGTEVKTAEQQCTFGSCPLDTEWTYDSEKYKGEHLVAVQATDQAGNTSNVPLRLVPANGSVPGCNPSNPAATVSTPETSKPIEGGGHVETYRTREGTISLTVPPAGFNPGTASEAELAKYGFPPRPSNPAEAKEWNESYSGAKSSRSDICSDLVRSDAKKPESGGALGTETNPNGIWSGYEAFNAENKDVWTAIKGKVRLPVPQMPQCTGGNLLSEWVGLGGDEEREPPTHQGFIQAGAEEDSTETLNTWIEYYARGGGGTSITLGIPVAQGDLLEEEVAYNTATEIARIVLFDATKREYFPPTTVPLSRTAYYSGSSAEFVDERSTYGEVNRPGELRNFGSITWTHAEVRSKEGWRPIAKEPLRRNVMRSGKTVLAEPGPIGSDNRSYVDQWKNCHG